MPDSSSSRFQFINMKGSSLLGLNAQGATLDGNVNLEQTVCRGETNLAGAMIGGQLNLAGARVESPRGDALNAESMRVKGNVFLTNADFEGQVSLAGARVDGLLDCSCTRFSNNDGSAFSAQRLSVGQGLYWKEVCVEKGWLEFSSTDVGDLIDDIGSWPDGQRVYLNGFTYDRIREAFLDAPRRLEWLRRGTQWEGEFFPQPYTQLAKILREMGHDRTARMVLMERERLIREEERKGARFDPEPAFADGSRVKPVIGCKVMLSDIHVLWSTIWDRALRWLAGYGYAPGRSFRGFLGLLLTAWVMAWFAWGEGSFAPNDGAVLVSEAWQEFADDPGNPAAAWSAEGAPGMDWDSFNAFGYAADLVVPILDLGQTEAWAPSKDRGSWGWGLWWGRWVLSALGWVVTALGAAAITGIIQPRRE